MKIWIIKKKCTVGFILEYGNMNMIILEVSYFLSSLRKSYNVMEDFLRKNRYDWLDWSILIKYDKWNNS
jgi:hypothetical protein